MIPESVKRKVIRNDDYSLAVGARKATGNVIGNAVVAATPATFLVMVARYNGLDLWPVEADAAAATSIMVGLTGVTRWIEDFFRMNWTEVNYQRAQAAQEPQEDREP